MADYALPPLEVFALSDGFLRLTGSIPYKSLIWTRRYSKSGEFSMIVPSDVYSPEWSFIYADDRPEMGIIQKVEFSDSAATYGGVDTVTISGFFLESVLNNIVFLVESPDQKKVYVPEPRRPIYNKSQNPKIYHDGTTGFYYTNQAGDVVSAETGKVVSPEGLQEAEYRPAFGASWGGDTVECTYNYYSADRKNITVVDWRGNEKTYPIKFADDRGNVFYHDTDAKEIRQAVGVVEKREDTYAVKKKRWDALPDDDPYGRYYLETVKGAWQRTDAMEPVTEGDSVATVLNWARRMMGDWLLYEEPKIKGIVKAVDPSFQYLGDLLYATLAEVGASLRLEYLFRYNKFILSVYRGKDRTQDQSGNPWAVFSDTWGTLTGYDASEDVSNYKNTCFVLYDYEKPDSFDASGWPSAGFIHAVDDSSWLPTLYGIRYTKKRGYNTEHQGSADEPAIETYLDLRDEKPTCDGDWSREVVEIPTAPPEERAKAIEAAKEKFAKPTDAYDMRAVYDAYEKALTGRGTAYLKDNHAKITTLDTGVIKADRYLKDFDLGDTVDLAVSTVGLVKTARIIEVEESYDDSGGHIALEIGDERLHTVQKARLV